MAYRETDKVRSRKKTVREAILRAGRERIAAGGYAAAQIQAVAEEAGVATGTVYRYFDSKADLCAEVFRTVVRHEVDAVDAAAHGHGAPAQRLRTVIETFTSRALRSPRLAYALLAEPVDPLVEAERLLFRHTYARLIRDVVADGIASSDFAPQDPDLSAAALVGALNETLVGPLSPTPERDYLPNDTDTHEVARISHHRPTATADAHTLTGRTPSSRLDVVAATPAPSSGPCAPSGRRLDALATDGGEKCGLVEGLVAFCLRAVAAGRSPS